MPTPSPAEFWSLLVRTRLVDRAAAESLARAAASAGVAADTRAIADWLVGRGTITRWQRKRLVIGDEGPFFLGDYRLLERLEQGGAALVFTARHEPTGRAVRLVRLDGKSCRDPATWQAIMRRTKTAIGLDDPALSRTWALEEAGRHRFIVCESVAGESLADELARRGRLPILEAGRIALEIARPLATLHAAGEVHGWLAPEAAMRPPGDGQAAMRLLQFPLGCDPHVVPSRPPVGTADEVAGLGRRSGYLAPELHQPGSAATPAADVYALGCILHALVTGATPCWRGDPAATLRQAAATGPDRLGPPAVPAEFGTLVAYLTAREPQGRYPDGRAAAEAIAACFGLPLDAPAAAAGSTASLAPAMTAKPAVAAAPAATSFPSAAAAAAAGPLPAASGDVAGEAVFVPRPATRRRTRRGAGGLITGAAVAATLVAAAAFIVPKLLDQATQQRAKPGADAKRPAPAAVAGRDRDREAPAPAAPEPAAAKPAPASPAATTAAPAVAVAAPAAAPAARFVAIDDPELPWAPPTAGPPLAFAYLPPGSRLLLAVRLADLLAAGPAGDEGRLVLRALGAPVEAAVTEVATACGCTPADIELVEVGWETDDAGNLVAGWMVRLVPGKSIPTDDAIRGRAWGPPAPDAPAGTTIHRGRRWSFWVPEEGRGSVLVAAAHARLLEIAAGPPDGMLPLSGELETLCSLLDSARHVTLVGSPHFLLHGGRAVLIGPLAAVAGPLEAFFGESVQAAAVSAHFGSDFHAELTAIPSRDLPPVELAKRLADGIAGAPDAVEAWCARLDPHPHGRRLVLRLPGMLQAVAANARAGTEASAAVLTVRLPPRAGHNLALATELALAQPQLAAPAAGPVAAAAPKSALERLEKPMTLVFTKDTLENTMQMIADEVGVRIEILGKDLQLEGITQNQSFALDERDKPAAAILRSVLAKANSDGKLVYVVRVSDGTESLVITTRTAAAKRGETLPPAFQSR
jgi:serine/threonine-protein kinase